MQTKFDFSQFYKKKLQNQLNYNEFYQLQQHILSLLVFIFINNFIYHQVFLIYDDGRKALEVRRKFNKQISLNVCEYSLRKNLQLNKNQIDLTRRWPKSEKIQKQITEDFFQHLQIILWDGSLKIFDCPVTLSEELAKCTTTLTLYAGDKIQANDQLFEEIRKQIYPKRSLVENIYFYLFNFIYNIPSDYYRLINPNKIQQFYEKQEIKKKEQKKLKETQAQNTENNNSSNTQSLAASVDKVE